MIHVAAITPRGRQGDIDFGAAFELIDKLCSQGADGIVLFGAPGEYAVFGVDERSRLTYLAVKRSRVPVIAGVGSASLDLSLDLARESRGAGAAALLLPPPYFSVYDQDDLREFYLEFARQLGGGVPVYLANTRECRPGIELATALDLLATGHFEGIADSAGFDCVRHAGHRALGDDWNCEHALAVGAPVISAAACAVPELLASLDRAIAGGRQDETWRLGDRLREFLGWVDQFPVPALLKVAIGLRGLETGPLTMPLSPGKQRKMDEFREWFREWSK